MKNTLRGVFLLSVLIHMKNLILLLLMMDRRMEVKICATRWQRVIQESGCSTVKIQGYHIAGTLACR